MSRTAQNTLSLICSLAFSVVVICTVVSADTALSDFIEIPLFSETELSPQQFDLLHATLTLAGDKQETRQLQACEDLINDSTCPFELYRYAFLRQVTLYSYVSREDLALQVGRAWLSKYPNDNINLKLPG